MYNSLDPKLRKTIRPSELKKYARKNWEMIVKDTKTMTT
jgi:hypothetical protein